MRSVRFGLVPPGPLVLVAHGSRDPRAAVANQALAAAVTAAWPPVAVTPVAWSPAPRARVDARVAFLDHGGPRPADVLRDLEAEGARRATLVPLLLTAAYHGRVDIPAAVMAAREAGLRLPVSVADVLGPVDGVTDPLLVTALVRRLRAADAAARVWAPEAVPLDGVVLAAAGTRDAAARETVEAVARELSAALEGVPCRVAYASAAAPDGAGAVGALRAAGARRIGVASYFLAPGLLHEAVVASARQAGATVVAEPLGGASELARLVLARAATARETACTLSAAA